jgi:uncharacterized protein YecA (UPF0149 family)
MGPVRQQAQRPRPQEDARAKIFEKSSSNWSSSSDDDDVEVFEVVDADEPAKQEVIRPQWKVRPNDPCPCGSGKKYKKCHWKDE